MKVIIARIYNEPLVAVGFAISALLFIVSWRTAGLDNLTEAQIGVIFAPLLTSLAGRPFVSPYHAERPPTEEVDQPDPNVKAAE